MSFSVDFDEARVLITVATAGTQKDVRLDALRAVRMDPRFRDDYRILCDFFSDRQVPDRAECLDLGLTVSAYFRGQKIALVVSEFERPKLSECISVFNTGRVEIGVFDSTIMGQNWLLSEREAIAA